MRIAIHLLVDRYYSYDRYISHTILCTILCLWNFTYPRRTIHKLINIKREESSYCQMIIHDILSGDLNVIWSRLQCLGSGQYLIHGLWKSGFIETVSSVFMRPRVVKVNFMWIKESCIMWETLWSVKKGKRNRNN